VSTGAAGAAAQTTAPVALDPSVAGQGTALVVAADATLLSRQGQPAGSITLALARGMRVDRAARERLCTRAQAARSRCPGASRIGFGRLVMSVLGYLPTGGATELAWSLDAYLGTPVRRGDVASVVLQARLLGADSVDLLLEPLIGTSVPRSGRSSGRLVQRASGEMGIELRFAELPVGLGVAAPVSVTPARLELTLSAVRRTRQNFVRRVTVRTPSGYEIRRIRDHRLIGHHLLRTPERCGGSWPYELRVGFPDGVRRTRGRIDCTQTP
jgi:hypothetical protein